MRTMLCAMAVLMLAVTVGCENKNKVAKNDSVLDVNVAPTPPQEPSLAYAGPLAGAPGVQPAAPAYYDPAITQTPAASTAAPSGSAGGSYTVKKGDTLFSIAKANYGSGNQWQRIAAANPGLAPETLKAGQRIVIP